MSHKITILTVAALVLGMPTTSAFASDASYGGGKKMHQRAGYDARSSAVTRTSNDWPYGAREPFTAAEKRAFQTPTGAEVDRW